MAVLVMALVFAVGACGGGARAAGFLDAAGFEAEMRDAAARVPFPPGTDAGDLTASDRSGSYEAGGGRSMVEFRAMCAWYRDWLDAVGRAEQPRISRDIGVIGAFNRWYVYSTGDWSFRRIVDDNLRAARDGDPDPIARHVEINCG